MGGISDEFTDITQALQYEFLPTLFEEELAEDDVPGQLACLPVKKAGLAIHDLTKTVDSNYTASRVICGHLVVALMGNTEFQSADHSAVMAAGKAETKRRTLELSTEKLGGILIKPDRSSCPLYHQWNHTLSPRVLRCPPYEIWHLLT
jgi:hypothetical protein